MQRHGLNPPRHLMQRHGLNPPRHLMQRHGLNPPRHLSAAGLPRWQGLVCDWSMVYEDGTVFVQQRRRAEEDGTVFVQQRRRAEEEGVVMRNRFRYNAGDETVIFNSSSPVILDGVSGGGGGVWDDETIAKEIGKRIVEARSDDEEGIGIGMCVVCQEQLSMHERRRRIGIARLDCGHQFHPKCIQKWLSHKNNCPLCKATALHLPSSNSTL